MQNRAPIPFGERDGSRDLLRQQARTWHLLIRPEHRQMQTQLRSIPNRQLDGGSVHDLETDRAQRTSSLTSRSSPHEHAAPADGLLNQARDQTDTPPTPRDDPNLRPVFEQRQQRWAETPSARYRELDLIRYRPRVLGRLPIAAEMGGEGAGQKEEGGLLPGGGRAKSPCSSPPA
jgi:hypothetical protein